MLISCEKCSTTYVLDDKLIPAQGAPVQCTRCGHVFLAKAPDTAAAAGGAKSTQMFGSPDPAPPPPTSRTQMFGAPGAPGGLPNPNKTVMFGVAGAEAPPKSKADAPAASRTMMFGHNNAAPGVGAANKTVIFGAPGSEAPAAPAAPASGGGVPSKTVMFGAPGADAAPAPQPTSRTMMFGAGGSDAPAAGQATNRTMMFGAAGATPAAADSGGGAGGVNKTMMFGVNDGAPAPAPAAPPSANPRHTMMFGAAQATQPAPVQTPAPRNTMMFGAAGAQETQPTVPPPAQQKTSSTMMFGTRAPVPAAPGPAAPPKTSSTMIFGATPVAAPGATKAPKLSESTVRIGPDDLERMMREHDGRSGDGGLTPPEPGLAAPAADRQNKTQMFAMTGAPDGATPPAGNDPVSRHNKTQMFAMTPNLGPEPGSQGGSIQGRKTRPPSTSVPEPKVANLHVDPSILDTFPPDAQKQPDPLAQTMVEGGPAIVEPRHKKTTQPDLAGVDASPRAELPPEAPDLLQSPGVGVPTAPMSPVDGDPAAALRAQVARRNRIALIFFALVLVVAALAVTWRVFGKMLLTKAPPAAAVEATEKALSVLRGDDSKSKEAAVTQLLDVTAKYPDYIEGHAGLVTAMTLQLDDVMQRVHRIEQLVDRKKTQVERYRREHSPANWETAAQQLKVQVDELIEEYKPLSEAGAALDKKTREAYKGLDSAVTRGPDPSKTARLAAIRAQALYHAVSGTDQAEKLLKKYEDASAGAPRDGWIDLTVPEYAANARVSEEVMAEAFKKIERLHREDSTFLRTYVLSARLHLIKREIEAATSDLDAVLLLRKDHDVATELREWVRKLPAPKEEKKDAPAP